MKSFLFALTFLTSFSAFSECLVELDTKYNRSFIKFTCSEALRDCNRYKHLQSIEDNHCKIIDPVYAPPIRSRDNPDYRYSITIIEDFISGHSDNCRVIPFIDNKYHQVYIDGIFKGNYEYLKADDLSELQNLLNKYVFLNKCKYNL